MLVAALASARRAGRAAFAAGEKFEEPPRSGVSKAFAAIRCAAISRMLPT